MKCKSLRERNGATAIGVRLFMSLRRAAYGNVYKGFGVDTLTRHYGELTVQILPRL